MQACRLRYTPRRLLVVPDSRLLVIGEADHAAIPLAEREDLQVGSMVGVRISRVCIIKVHISRVCSTESACTPLAA